jgi:hypothetical protein
MPAPVAIKRMTKNTVNNTHVKVPLPETSEGGVEMSIYTFIIFEER